MEYLDEIFTSQGVSSFLGVTVEVWNRSRAGQGLGVRVGGEIPQ